MRANDWPDFEKRIQRRDGCWLWGGSVLRDGYGQMCFKGKTRKAHQLAWEFFRGHIPAGMMVCHRCDVRHCVNPEHLFLGTAKDNVADMFAKGRQHDRKGEKHGHAKLTAEQVREIRVSRENQYELAERHGLSQSAISNIRTRKSWAHIP
jgi:hypothetical protein